MTLKKPSFSIIGLPLRTDNSKASTEIAEHWARFQVENILAKIPNKKSNAIYGLYTDYVSDHTQPYTLIIGCEVEPNTTPPPGLVLKNIPAATYTQIPLQGAFPQNIISGWQRVWQSNLPRAFSADFELYDADFATNQKVSLFIAVKDQHHRCSCHCH